MLKIPLLIILILIVGFSFSPGATKVKDFLQAKLTNTKEDSMNSVNVGVDDAVTDLNQASPSATPSAKAQQSTTVKEEKIDKTEGSIRYQGTVKSSQTETKTNTTENGTKTVTNSNTLNSSTNINVQSDTGGNEGQNVSNGNSKVSVKVTTNGDGTTIDYP